MHRRNFARFYKRIQRILISEVRSLNSLNSIGFISELGGFPLNLASQFVHGADFVYEIRIRIAIRIRIGFRVDEFRIDEIVTLRTVGTKWRPQNLNLDS